MHDGNRSSVDFTQNRVTNCRRDPSMAIGFMAQGCVIATVTRSALDREGIQPDDERRGSRRGSARSCWAAATSRMA